MNRAGDLAECGLSVTYQTLEIGSLELESLSIGCLPLYLTLLQPHEIRNRFFKKLPKQLLQKASKQAIACSNVLTQWILPVGKQTNLPLYIGVCNHSHMEKIFYLFSTCFTPCCLAKPPPCGVNLQPRLSYFCVLLYSPPKVSLSTLGFITHWFIPSRCLTHVGVQLPLW